MPRAPRAGDNEHHRPDRSVRRPVVAVTEARGLVGRAVLSALAASDAIGGLIAVADTPGAMDGVTWRLTDPERMDGVLDGVDVLIHPAAPDDLEQALRAGSERRSRILQRFDRVMDAAAAQGVQQVYLITSAMVLGIDPRRAEDLDDDSQVAAIWDEGVVGDMLELEVQAARRRRAGLRLASVRPAALVGAGVDTMCTRHFEAPRLLATSDIEMRWQFCHLEDLGSALEFCVRHEVCRDVVVGAPGHLSAQRVEELSGMRRVTVSRSFGLATAQQLHKVGVLPMPATDLEYVVTPWVVEPRVLTSLGWRARYDNPRCLRVMLSEVSSRRTVAARRLGRTEAVGAAGAAVAAMGTAAVWRQARRRRNRV